MPTYLSVPVQVMRRKKVRDVEIKSFNINNNPKLPDPLE
ncbi:hypothetical protein G9C98_006185, partial [Cotesia typhae]